MQRFFFFVSVASLLICAGCGKHEGIISLQERVIMQPEKKNFGLVGTWYQHPSDPVFETDEKTEAMTIKMADDGVYTVQAESLGEGEVWLRAISLDANPGSNPDGADDAFGYAIVDIEIKLKGQVQFRSLAVVKRQGDDLFVGYIESKNLAKLMHVDGHSAVIERGTFSTKVHAKPDQLIACVRNHFRELIGSSVIFRSSAK